MNHIYRLVRSRVTGLMVAVSELTKAPGTTVSRGRKVRSGVLAAALLSSIFTTSTGVAGPTGGSVVSGNATITTSGTDAANTTINQTSQNAILNWQSFGIAAHESVQFVQPDTSSVTLNRVLGADASQIMGSLTSNGKIFLINPNGVLFGRGAQVNVGGLIASTRNITDGDFLSGRYFFSGSNDATVANYGSITADGGYVALLGAHVDNQGLISARLGSIALASGDAFTLDTAGDGLLSVTVNAGAIRSLVENGGVVRADGGQVVMTARSAGALVQSVVNNTGVVQAQTIENRNGVIKLIGDMDSGVVNVGGRLDASAPTSGDGGFIDTSAAHVVIAPDLQVTTLAVGGATGNWLIDPVDFTIAASGGDITGAQLSTSLSGSNNTIQSSSGATGTSGNINVNATVTWSANRLTLSAYNNININTAMMGSGTASLALNYGQGAVAAGNTSTANINAPVNLAAGNNFSTQLGSDGAVVNYTVITSLGAAGSTTGTDLQGINGNLAGNYVLGANIDASSTSGWNAGAGFVPIGVDASRFTGNFDGLGHTVSNIYINRTGISNTGMFGYTGAGSVVRNIGLLGGSVTSDSWSTGSVVGQLAGSLFNSYATTSVNGFQTVGGLVGVLDGGLIDGSHASGTVHAGANGEAGGLVGLSWGPGGGTTRNSYATGNVSSAVGNAGGLMGINWGTIINSYATGTATGVDYVGGLVGNNSNGTVTTSYATGAVSGNNYVGGLVGNASNTITNSYATGTVSGASVVGGLAGMSNTTLSGNYATGNVTATGNFAGGLVGSNSGTVSGSYARGNVSGGDQIAGLVGGHNSGSISLSSASGTVTATTGSAGGLVGYSAAPISTSYASGAVSGVSQVGGLLGAMNGSSVTDSYATGNVTGTSSVGGAIGNSTNGAITRVYSSGAVSGTTNVGGLLGSQTNATVTNSYWNTTTSAQSTSAGGTGLTTSQLQTSLPTGFSSATWGNGSNRTTPYLLNNLGTVLIDTDTSATYYNVIATLQQLQNIDARPTVNYVLVNDIDASATSSWNSGLGFMPIGTPAEFSGIFDGLGHVVSNLYINRPGMNNVGLFGRANGATFRNVGVTNGAMTGNTYVGLLVGNCFACTYSRVYSTGSSSGYSWVGGLVGLGNGTTMTSSYSTANVTGTDTLIGGLFGQARFFGTITDSYATGNVSAGNAYYVGGFAGQARYVTLTNTYATGNVTADGGVGGLVGLLDGATINTSYASGAVSGGWEVGGLVGSLSQTTAVNNSYWNTTTSGQTFSYGGTGLTTAQMQTAASFTGFDLSNSWIVYEGHTAPLLRTFMTALTITANDATKTYDGLAYNGSAGVSYSTTPNMSNVLGTLTVSGGTTNAGTSTTSASGLYSNQQGYAITYVNGTLTVNKAVLTATVTADNKVYDGTTTASATIGTLTGFVGTETVSVASNAATFNSKDVSTANLVTVNGVTFSNGSNGGLASNYTFATGQTASANITTKALTATASAGSKTYDGTTTASATLGSLTGLVGSETINTSTTASFNTKDVATANVVTVDSVTLSNGSNGGLASNYSFATGQTTSANITAKTLTASASATNKTYDGTTTASATLGSLTGFVGTETVGAAATATFNTKDVATANTVTVTGVTLSDGANGGLASNYSLAGGQTASANITAKALTATASATDKVYDGTTNASVTLGSLNGLVGTETLNTSTAASFNTKDVATANVVTVDSVTLSNGSNGGLASNYSFAGGQTTSGSITQKSLTASASAANKVYDGTTTANATITGLSGFVGSETLTATGTATFNSKDVVTANQVTVNSVSLADGANGGLASNYSLASGQTASANITQKTLTATASAINKVYDGTTTAGATLGSLTGLVGTETVGTSATATFNTKDVATANVVTVSGVTLSDGANGGLASNYSLAGGQTANASITVKTLTATASANDKVYDGTTAASATLGSLTGLIGTETLGTTTTAAFNTKDVATANTVTVSGVTLSDGANGGLASNYSLASGQTANASITAKALTATASATDKIYDGNTTASVTLGSLNGLVGAETLNTSTTASFNTKDVATANTVTVDSVGLSNGSNGGLASNYSFASGQTTGANITAKTLTASASATDKVYDGNATASATLNVTGLVGSETVTATGTATFNSKDVATANQVTVNSVSLADGTNGGLASNYSLASGQTATANITQKALTATASAANKVYDGATTASATLGSVTGLVGTETVGTMATASFNSKDVATANVVTVSGVTLADGANGGLASNYSLAGGQTANANITAKTLTATASATDKVYDGTTTANATLGSLTGLVGTETINTTATASFNTKDVATANAVTVSSVTLSDGANGGLASNYSLASGQTASASITQRTLTATASATDKVYDGTSTATASLGSITGLVGAETINTSATASFNSKDVATANVVTVSGVTLADGSNGGLASNYVLASGQTASAHITQRTLTATASATDRVYDGTTAASATLGSVAGLIGTETIGVSASASFNTKDVATANLVTVDSVSLSNGTNGGLASNYTMASGQTASAHITPRALSASAAAAAKVYDGTTDAAATLNNLSGFVGNETVVANVTGQFNSKDVATANLVTINSVTLNDGANGGVASNYSLVTGQTAAATITSRQISVEGLSALDKVYDGTTAATLTGGTLVGVIGGDNVSLTRSGSFATPSAGQQIVVASSSALSGGDAANYTLVQPSGLSASITPVIGVAIVPSGVNPIAAYRSARVTPSANSSIISTENSSMILPAIESGSASATPSSPGQIDGLNLTIVGGGLNTRSTSANEQSDDKK